MALPSDNSVHLRNAEGIYVKAQLVSELGPEHLDDLNLRWKEELNRMQTPDRHWDWEALYRDARNRPFECRIWAIVLGHSVQGILRVNLMHRTRTDTTRHLVYIERIASSPSNRPPYGQHTYRPVGSLLLRQAVLESFESESYGRIGLHALPTAASWYRDKLGMISFGIDAEHENLEYFEFTNAQALQFLGAEAVRQLEALGIPTREPSPHPDPIAPTESGASASASIESDAAASPSLGNLLADPEAFLLHLKQAPGSPWQDLRDSLRPPTAKLLEALVPGLSPNGILHQTLHELLPCFTDPQKSPLGKLLPAPPGPDANSGLFSWAICTILAERFPDIFRPPEPPTPNTAAP